VKVTIPSDEIDALLEDAHASGYPFTLALIGIVNPVVRKNFESLLDWVPDQTGAPDVSIVGAGTQ
jgi:hypothetical protein